MGGGVERGYFFKRKGIEFDLSFICVDINPKKIGKYVADRQRIVSPEFLRQYQPETVILIKSGICG
jgi:hypothetical protein